jgi:predicted dehydrogenase
MNSNKTRIALVGCGNMGNYYAYNLSKMNDVTIKICCDPSETKLNKFREKWNIPSGTTDWKSLFPQKGKQNEIDGIINCSVDNLHGEIFKSCTESTLALLTEKPFAVPFEILNTFSPENFNYQKLVINFSKRSIPAIAAAQQSLDENCLGRIHRMELHYRQGWVLNHDYGDWHDTSAWFWRLTEEHSHHGVLGDLGSHLFDLASYFCGSVETVSCNLNRIDKGIKEYKGQQLDSMDDAQCLLQMQNGADVLVNASRTAAGEKDGLEILISGENGSIKIKPEESMDSYKLFLIETGEWQTIPCPLVPRKNLDSFIELFRNEELSDFPGIRDSIYNHVMIEAAAASAEEGSRINLNAFGEKNLGEIWRKTVVRM